jgi:molybdopterin molybdotransferase
MIERTKLEADQVMIDDGEFAVGQNIMPQGLEYRRGEEVLHPGCRLGPAELGLLASVGQIEPLVFRRPRLAILSTGDEVCPANQTPGPNQIRNSNEWTLYAACLRAGAEVRLLGIARDDETDLKSKIAQGLAADVLLLSGGVSTGKRDLVPRMLQALGVDEIFHGVAFKPGKPLWFGRREGTLVFGLPGNPVSVLCCFEVFVQTALRVRQGSPNPFPPMIDARLAEDVNYPTRRTTYHPAWLDREGETVTVRPVTWKGSPDLRALINANALVVFPEGPGQYAKGDCLKVLPL